MGRISYDIVEDLPREKVLDRTDGNSNIQHSFPSQHTGRILLSCPDDPSRRFRRDMATKAEISFFGKKFGKLRIVSKNSKSGVFGKKF